MSDVIWCAHPIHVNYEASSDGRVRSVGRQVQFGDNRRFSPSRELKLTSNGAYLTFSPGRGMRARVHRFICEAFHGLAKGPGIEVRHLNGNKLDNRAENLCWGTRSENNKDRINHGTCYETNKTHCPRGHEYTPENTYAPPSKPHIRVCRACMPVHRERAKARRRSMAG
jgi:hypothetical protein